MLLSNKSGIQTVFDRFLTFGSGARDAVMADNAEWLDSVQWLDMLRDIGRHFTINKMIALDIVRRRLDAEIPITFLEFNYMLLQAYDFLELSRRYDCRLQMGGSDQWGNIVQGVELCRRADAREVFGVTQPLLMNSAGQKMGKTANGAVWLNADMLAPFDYWQYWRNIDDADVGKVARLITDLPVDEIRRLEALEGAEINAAKVAIATEATALLHGRAAAEAAAETARAQFSGAGAVGGLPEALIEDAAGLSIAALFVKAGLVESNGEAKRHVKAGALRINDVAVSDAGADVDPGALRDGLKLSLGKKRHVLARAV